MIVAVAGGKGGVGKSTIAWNVGAELDAVVVDVDLTTPDIPNGRGPDLHDVLVGRASPLAAVEQIGSVTALPAGRSLAGARASDLRALPDVLEQLERHYGQVLVDCPAGLARDVGIALNAADVTLLVTGEAHAALLAAMQTRALARDLETPIAAVVVNRVTDPADTGLCGAVEDEFSAPVTVVPEAAAVARTVFEGQTVRDVSSDTAVLDPIAAIADQLRACRQRATNQTDRT